MTHLPSHRSQTEPIKNNFEQQPVENDGQKMRDQRLVQFYQSGQCPLDTLVCVQHFVQVGQSNTQSNTLHTDSNSWLFSTENQIWMMFGHS